MLHQHLPLYNINLADTVLLPKTNNITQHHQQSSHQQQQQHDDKLNLIPPPQSILDQEKQKQLREQQPAMLPHHYYYTNRFGAFSQQTYNAAHILFHLPHIMNIFYDQCILRLLATLITLITVIIIALTYLNPHTYPAFLMSLLIYAGVHLYYLGNSHVLALVQVSTQLFRPALATLLYDTFYNTASITSFISYNLQFPLFYRSLLLLNTIKSAIMQKTLWLGMYLSLPAGLLLLSPIFLVMQLRAMVPILLTDITRAIANGSTRLVTNPVTGLEEIVPVVVLTPELIKSIETSFGIMVSNLKMIFMMLACGLPFYIAFIRPLHTFHTYTPFLNSALRYIDMATFLQSKRIIAINKFKYNVE
jgi:hypothetical protein